MTFATKLQEDVTRYTPGDRAALVEFQREVFGPQARQLDEKHFEWLFERNPCARGEGPQIWICRKNGKVIGQQAGIPFDLKVGNRYCRASWAIDLRVHPHWQLRGVGPALSETYVASNKVTVGLGITDAAYKAFLRAGWIDIGFVPHYVRPLDIRRMLRGRFPGRGAARFAGSVLPPVVRLVDALCEGYARARQADLIAVERFDDRVDALWEQVRGCHMVIARRDFRTLQWRFDAGPASGRYQRLYLLEGHRLRGYAVARMGTRYGAPVGIIVDYLSAPEWVIPLLARCAEHMRRAGAIAVYCTTLCGEARAQLAALGFAKRGLGTRLMVRFGGSSRKLPQAAASARNWFVTLADSDADHLLGR